MIIQKRDSAGRVLTFCVHVLCFKLIKKYYNFDQEKQKLKWICSTWCMVLAMFFSLLYVRCQEDVNQQLGRKKTANSTSALFRRITRNKRLNVTPLVVHYNCKLGECGVRCIRNISCESFNFKSATTECQLLGVDRNSKSDQVLFVQSDGWAYYDTGFNIRHPNWRNKYLHNITCPVNKCGACQCIIPTEETNHLCDCFSKEGLIQTTNTWCWSVHGGCNAINGTKVLLKACNATDQDQQFLLNGNEGYMLHRCSGKYVCNNVEENNIVVNSLTCADRWYSSDKGGWRYGSRCPFPKNGLIENNAELNLQGNKCFQEGGIHSFTKGVDGRVEVKMFRNINSLNGVTSSPNFPDNPTYGVVWFHRFFEGTYFTEAEFFGRQMKTIFVPPETGSYVFRFSCNEQGNLYVTYPDSAKQLIVTVSSYGVKTSSPQSMQAFKKYLLEAVTWEQQWSDDTKLGVTFPSGIVLYPLTDEYLLPPNLFY